MPLKDAQHKQDLNVKKNDNQTKEEEDKKETK